MGVLEIDIRTPVDLVDLGEAAPSNLTIVSLNAFHMENTSCILLSLADADSSSPKKVNLYWSVADGVYDSCDGATACAQFAIRWHYVCLGLLMSSLVFYLYTKFPEYILMWRCDSLLSSVEFIWSATLCIMIGLPNNLILI